MKYVIARYNHDASWIKEYTNDWVIYDRSEVPLDWDNVITVPNIGTDWWDKLGWIIDNYEALPDVVLLSKCNIFKYITPEEFEDIRYNQTLTPILTKNHKTTPGVSYYSEDGLYNEINNLWYLGAHPAKHDVGKLMAFLGIWGRDFVEFAPGSNYIVDKETILKHPKEDYEYLRSLLDWSVYPGEAQIIERGIYNWWTK